MQPRIYFRELVRMQPAAFLIWLICITASPAVEMGGLILAVDRPDDWAVPQASHHGKHGLSGAIFAPGAYMGLRLSGVPASSAKPGAIGLTVVAATLYELDNAARFGSWLDPVDIIWTVCGGLSACAGIGAGNWVITPIITPDFGGLAAGWRF